ncbi:unnamed protein product [Vitrella brassicaformis CCMP3155]|uniref:Uncharacterized protein n=1 Tax=Vitrella brassicaformis (strain CCMP3155) TaxID=1169540 RepID=A0A0G4GU21_VITBC|nr:unnamed protein product [Vitrella brassicaformis CCMP3155]|eukprot:CEM34232.1 unnamed protein product [Vitrella brassicaformis CCMP3155]
MENKYRTTQHSKNSEITDRTKKAYEDAQPVACDNAGGARQDDHQYVAAWKTTTELPDDVGASKVLEECPAYYERAVKDLREQHLQVIDSNIPKAGRGLISRLPLRAFDSFRGIKGVLLPGNLSSWVIYQKCLEYLRRDYKE